MLGYNPNRDSGIAEPRSYVEIGKESLQGLVDEYDFVPTATQRYFAQLVYNVGSGGGGGSGFEPYEVEALKKLVPYADALTAIADSSLITVNIDLNDFGTSVTDEETLLRVYTDPATGEYEIINRDPDGDDNYNTAEYIIIIPGYTCNVEAYAWVDQPGGTVTPDMEKLLPKLTYFPKEQAGLDKNGEQYKYGKTIIYLDKENEYEAITELPSDKRILRVTYIQLPSKNR